MNKNIEIINPHLMGISFSYIKMGWVTDFPMLNGKIDNPHMALSTDGILLINKDDAELYNIMKQMFDTKIMPMTDEQIKQSIQDMERQRGNPEFDKYSETYLWMLQTEQKRRTAINPKKKGGKSLWQRFKHQ